MSRPPAWIAGMCACAALAACDGGHPAASGAVCTPGGNFAVVVDVREAGTGAPLPRAWLILREGAYADSIGGSDGMSTLAAGFERAGTYQVTVRRPGYLDWRRENVAALRSGECNKLQRAVLTADLVPAP